MRSKFVRSSAIDTGQLIAGHYRLVEHIGNGAMGVVWRAIDERLERSVAVKQIFTQQGLSEDERGNVRQRAMREAKNAARFQHPNAIVVFDIAEHEGDPCLVMEYLPSRSLSAVLTQHGPMSTPQVARIGEQVASALAAAHRAGVVHRDIKPGNILLADNGTAKITDFGISRATGDLTLTETGLICGTPAYLAPEVARGADPTPAADVFALGATLYQALEGRPPYGNSTNQLALLYSAANAQVIAPRQSGPATSLLMSLLRADPEERPSMTEARSRLATLASAEVTAARPATTAPMPLLADDDDSGAQPVLPRPKPAPAPARPAKPPLVPVAAQAAPLVDPRPQRPSTGSSRMPLFVGAAVLVLVALAVVFGILDFSGGGHPAASSTAPAARPPASTIAAPDRTATSTTTAAPAPSVAAAGLGQTRSTGGPVSWQSAGDLIEQFYGAPGRSWSLLTPAAQQVYGSQAAFQQYWTTHQVSSFSGIHANGNANNPDGSVDMRLDSLSYPGQSKSLVLRVVSNGGLLIDSDTR